MQIVDKLIRFKMAVNDMPKAKAFYAEKLGLKVTTDYRRDDHNWWVSLALPEDGASIVVTTAHENMKPGTMSLYFASPDVAAAHQEISAKGAKVNEIKDDLYGPGSGVKWFNVEDPDGNQVFLVQA
ncbi:MAG TPA: glyoxalase superfamily protein [Bryobacteraceae bacterium]|nr:glyoxalase superfamily protein [Bryobacteraceae bacterium]